MKTRACCCGCGQEADSGAKYLSDHYLRLIQARRKWKRLRRHAGSRGVHFDLQLADFMELVFDRWPRTAWQVRRIDRGTGFTWENVVVVDRSGADAGEQLLVRRALAAIKRAGLQATVIDQVLNAFTAQGGRCATTGRPLRITGRLTGPDMLDIRPPDAAATDGTVVLVIRAVADHVRRWGKAHLLEMASAIARSERSAARSRKPGEIA